MLKKLMTRRLPALMLILTLANVMQCYGQSLASNPQSVKPQNDKVLVDAEFFKESQRALADRDRLKAEGIAKDELVASLTAQNAALRGLLDVEKQISASWKDAATNRKQALVTDDAIMKKYDEEIGRLREERNAARRNQKWYGTLGLVFGIAVGVYGSRRN